MYEITMCSRQLEPGCSLAARVIDGLTPALCVVHASEALGAAYVRVNGEVKRNDFVRDSGVKL